MFFQILCGTIFSTKSETISAKILTQKSSENEKKLIFKFKKTKNEY